MTSPTPPFGGPPSAGSANVYPQTPAWAPAPGQQPPPPAGVPAPKKKLSVKVLAIIVGGMLLLCCGLGSGLAALGNNVRNRAGQAVGNTAGDGVPFRPDGVVPGTGNPNRAPNATDVPGVAKTADPITGTMGKPVKGDNFEFIVSKVKCGVSRVGPGGGINESAQGQFCLVTVAVKNVGKEPARYSHLNIRAEGPGGVTYEVAEGAQFWANGNDNLAFDKEMNPGVSIHGIVVFDIPKDSNLAAVDLNDGTTGIVRIKVL